MKGSVALAMLALGHVGRQPAPTPSKPLAMERPPRAVVASRTAADPIATAIADLAKDWAPKLR